MYIIFTENTNLAELAKKDNQKVIEINDLVASTSNSDYRPDNNSSTSMNNTISDILISLGIPLHIKGFNFLLYAIETVLSRPDNVSFTKDIYPTTADHFQTRPNCIERNICTAICFACLNPRTKLFNAIFHKCPTTQKIKNSTFICGVVNYLKKEYNF